MDNNKKIGDGFKRAVVARDIFEVMCEGVAENFRKDGFVAPVAFFLSDKVGMKFYDVYGALKNGLKLSDVLSDIREGVRDLDAYAVILIQEVRIVENGLEKRNVVLRFECVDGDERVGEEVVFELDTENRSVVSVIRDRVKEFVFFGLSDIGYLGVLN
jgi:hypothetical protein